MMMTFGKDLPQSEHLDAKQWNRLPVWLPRGDAMRAAAMTAVVTLHVTQGLVLKLSESDLPAWWIADLLYAATCWSVPVFVMISGGIFLNPNRPCDPLRFFRRRICRVGVPWVFWTAFYLVRYLQARSWDVPLLDALYAAARGHVAAHLYFLRNIGLVYLMTPLLRRIVQGSSEQRFVVLTIAIFLLSSIASTLSTCGFLPRAWSALGFAAIGRFLIFVAYYCAGLILRRWENRLSKLGWLWAGAIAAVVVTAVLIAVSGLHGDMPFAVALFSLWHSPNVVIMAVIFYLLLTNVSVPSKLAQGPVAKLVARLATASLGIYLLHWLFLVSFRRLGFGATRPHVLLGIPLTVVAAVSASYLVTAGVRRIPVLRWAIGS